MSKSRRKNSDAEYKLSESETDSEEYDTDDSDKSTGKSSGRPSPGRKNKKTVVGSKGGSGASTPKSERSNNTSHKKSTSASRRTVSRKKQRRQNTLVAKQAATNTPTTSTHKVVPKIVVRNPTKKFVVIPKKQTFHDGYLVPPKVKRKKSKSPKSTAANKSSTKAKKNDKENKENEENGNKFSEDIELLSKLPLPSATIRHRFNQNISMIGSINIQSFGKKKASNHVLMRIITDILRRYDIVLCQEIHAPENDVSIIQQLCDEVSTPNSPYSYVTSPPIGRGKYQERYVYLYRRNEWKVIDEYVIEDDEKLGDLFMREPFVVHFQHLRKANIKLILVGCHTQPTKAFEEVSALAEQVYGIVRNNVIKKSPSSKNIRESNTKQQSRGITDEEDQPHGIWQILKNIFCCCLPNYSPVSTREITSQERSSRFSLSKPSYSIAGNSEKSTVTNDPIVMMGDFNAAGSYVNKAKRAELDAILKKNGLVWGIHNTTDTTVADGEFTAYDRFVFEEENVRRWIGNSGVWRFDDGWLNGKYDNELVKRAAKHCWSYHEPINEINYNTPIAGITTIVA
ncbi:7863_t:CDS:2 [Ambispora leptoticha]|uniref:7863_t:CDS:1 n=1 Tax=Ambispora leptoticha TaxID=144679 RepID=A0A9N9EQS3_9GLOM|nr:7863_t:CDS:2 [Ambispora leptoticha]